MSVSSGGSGESSTIIDWVNLTEEARYVEESFQRQKAFKYWQREFAKLVDNQDHSSAGVAAWLVGNTTSFEFWAIREILERASIVATLTDGSRLWWSAAKDGGDTESFTYLTASQIQERDNPATWYWGWKTKMDETYPEWHVSVGPNERGDNLPNPLEYFYNKLYSFTPSDVVKIEGATWGGRELNAQRNLNNSQWEFEIVRSRATVVWATMAQVPWETLGRPIDYDGSYENLPIFDNLRVYYDLYLSDQLNEIKNRVLAEFPQHRGWLKVVMTSRYQDALPHQFEIQVDGPHADFSGLPYYEITYNT
jgi:hypothetical protein